MWLIIALIAIMTILLIVSALYVTRKEKERERHD